MPRNDIDVFIFMKRRILKFLVALVLFFAASFCFALTKLLDIFVEIKMYG